MTEAVASPDCVAPGRQAVLFHVDPPSTVAFCVIDRDGVAHTATRALGVAVSVAQQLVREHGIAWICGTDGTTARLDRASVASDAPQRPWVRTVASIHPRKEQVQ